MNEVAPNAPAAAAAALPWLVADIGGSNARFGWVDAAAADGAPLQVRHVRTLPVAAHDGPAAAAAVYLAGLREALARADGVGGGEGRAADAAGSVGASAGSAGSAGSAAGAGRIRCAAPRNAAFAVATAVDGDDIALTNSGWRFSRADVQRTLGVAALHVVNDFAALALALPLLQPAQLRAVGPLAPAAAPRGMLAVLGPGTGLGVAGVVQTRHGWLPLPGEGGHATLAAADDLEAAVLATVRAAHGHVSAERLLSGIGLPLLHAALATVLGWKAGPLTAQAIVDAGVGAARRSAAAGAGAADDASVDVGCRQTLEMFCALLGSFAGNVALTLGARGGVYIGGGIVPRIGELFFASRFRERFEAKGRFRRYLQAIPTALITDTSAALAGAALALRGG